MRSKMWLLSLLICLTFSSARADDDLTVSPGIVDPSMLENVNQPYPGGILTLGAGLAVFSGELSRRYRGSSVGWGLTVGFLKQIGEGSLYWGGDFGADFWGFPPPNTQVPTSSRTAMAIHTLPTLVYRFMQFSNKSFRPFFGVSMGPTLYVVRSSPATATEKDSSEVQLLIEAVARPGVEWALTKTFGLNFETRLGFLGWDFLVQPQLNLSISL